MSDARNKHIAESLEGMRAMKGMDAVMDRLTQQLEAAKREAWDAAVAYSETRTRRLVKAALAECGEEPTEEDIDFIIAVHGHE